MSPQPAHLIVLALSAAFVSGRADHDPRETEPNNSAATADSTVLGATLWAYINQPGDTDYYFIELEGGTDVAFRVDAKRSGSSLNSVLGLLDVDGRTVLAVNDDGNDAYVTDSRIWFHIPARGRYYLFVTSADGQGGARYGYDVSARTYTPEPPPPPPTEREPNNSSATANPATLGDTLIGVFNPVADRDVYAFDLDAGTKLEFSVLNKRGCIRYGLQGPGGGFSGGCDENFHGSREISVPGRYTLTLRPYEETSVGINSWYSVTLRAYQAPAPGPGDPAKLFATGFRNSSGSRVLITGLAADWSGGLYVATEHDIAHVSGTGAVRPFAQVNTGFGAIAVDGFGDLLVGSYVRLGNGQSRPVVWRFSPAGEQTVFADAPGAPSIMFTGIAIAPDGDVWFTDAGMADDSRLWRFDPVGNLKETIDVSATGRAWNMAISPHGELYFVNQEGEIYKLVGHTPQLVGRARLTHEGNPLAFDRDGYVYGLEAWGTDSVWGTWQPRGKVLLFDPQFNLVTDPFAQVLDSLGWSPERTGAGPTFVRDAQGNMTRRIMVTRWADTEDSTLQVLPDSARGSVRELDIDAVRAPGADIVPRFERVRLATGRSGTVASFYADTLTMPGGPARWALVAGELPPGIALDTQTGVLSGVPVAWGTFDFSVRGTVGTAVGYGRFNLVVAPTALAVVDVANALLGGPALPDSTARSLDQLGNDNGVLDAGDLRAYLRALGELPGAVAPGQHPASRLSTAGLLTQAENDRLRALLIRGRR